MTNPFGHIDLRVRDIEAALPFHEALLPALGFIERYDGPDWKVFASTDPLPAGAYFAIVESRDCVADQTRIAFWVEDREKVDHLAEIVINAGAFDVIGPKEMPYGPDYYAVYFADPSGNRFEIYHRLG